MSLCLGKPRPRAISINEVTDSEAAQVLDVRGLDVQAQGHVSRIL
jgi:hypothetical protein